MTLAIIIIAAVALIWLAGEFARSVGAILGFFFGGIARIVRWARNRNRGNNGSW